MKPWLKNLVLPLGAIVLGIGLLGAEPLRALMKSRSLASRTSGSGDSSESEKAEVKIQLDPTGLKKLVDQLPQARLRRIYFFDSQSLELFESGVILRARLDEKGEGDTTIKIREPHSKKGESPDPDYLGRDGFKCEWDVTQTSKRSCSYTKDRSALDFAHVIVARDRSIESLFSSKQLNYLEEHSGSPASPLPSWKSLRVLGPIQATTWKLKDPDFTIELWELPGVARFLELSTRTGLTDSPSAERELREWSQSLGLHPIQATTSKTEWVLKHLSARLK